MPVINDLNQLKPDVASAYRSARSDCADAGIKLKTFETLRTLQVQQAYYAQGRDPGTKKEYKKMTFANDEERNKMKTKIFNAVNLARKVAGLPATTMDEALLIQTYADGVKNPSNHQSGRAVDLSPVYENNVLFYNAPDKSKNPKAYTWYLETMAKVTEIFKAHGFIWGGDWKTSPGDPIGWDPAHYELPEVKA